MSLFDDTFELDGRGRLCLFAGRLSGRLRSRRPAWARSLERQSNYLARVADCYFAGLLINVDDFDTSTTLTLSEYPPARLLGGRRDFQQSARLVRDRHYPCKSDIHRRLPVDRQNLSQ